MRKLLVKYGFVLMLAFVALQSHAFTRTDSIGRRIVKGKIVILHKVEPKQTVYAISKLYNVNPGKIYEANPTSRSGLKVGQLLKVPTNRNADGNTTVINDEGQKTHKVAKKETLYSISKMYNVTVDDLKKWNKLPSNDLDEGETLIVSEKGAAEEEAMATNNGLTSSDGKYELVLEYRESQPQTSDAQDENEEEVKEAPKEEQPEKVEPVKEEEVMKSEAVAIKEDPTPEVEKEEEPEPKPQKQFPPGTKTHLVEKQETMYGISKQYNISIEDIKRWNDLNTTALNEGQLIAVSGEPDPNAEKEDLMAANTTKSNLTGNNTGTTTQANTTNPAKSNSTTATPNKTPTKTTTNPAFSNQSKSRFEGDDSFSNVGGGNERFHSVAQGEGLYSISKKYGVSIDDLKRWNNLGSDDIDFGQILLVTAPSSAYQSAYEDMLSVNYEEQTGKSAPIRSANNAGTGAGTGTGGNRNEPYSESTDPYYINKMKGKDHANEVLYGTVINGTGGETDSGDESEFRAHEEQEKVQEALMKSQAKLESHKTQQTNYMKDQERLKKQQAEQARQQQMMAKAKSEKNLPYDMLNIPRFADTWEDSCKYGIRGMKTNVGQYGKIAESGICEVIKDNHWDSKYNCLHYEAEIGTIIQVHNPWTGVSVFVRVVGRMNEDSKNPNRIIKISHHAVERLKPASVPFPVEITYLNMNRPPNYGEN